MIGADFCSIGGSVAWAQTVGVRAPLSTMIAVIFGVFSLKEASQRTPPPTPLIPREFIPTPLHEWGRKMGEGDPPPVLSLFSLNLRMLVS